MVALLVLLTWVVLALGAALVIGRVMREADRRALGIDDLFEMPAELTVEHILAAGPAQHSR
jgi:ribosomal silencing factor RsfS